VIVVITAVVITIVLEEYAAPISMLDTAHYIAVLLLYSVIMQKTTAMISSVM